MSNLNKAGLASILLILVICQSLHAAPAKLKRSNGKKWGRIKEIVASQIRLNAKKFLEDRHRVRAASLLQDRSCIHGCNAEEALHHLNVSCLHCKRTLGFAMMTYFLLTLGYHRACNCLWRSTWSCLVLTEMAGSTTASSLMSLTSCWCLLTKSCECFLCMLACLHGSSTHATGEGHSLRSQHGLRACWETQICSRPQAYGVTVADVVLIACHVNRRAGTWQCTAR